MTVRCSSHTDGGGRKKKNPASYAEITPKFPLRGRSAFTEHASAVKYERRVRDGRTHLCGCRGGVYLNAGQSPLLVSAALGEAGVPRQAAPELPVAALETRPKVNRASTRRNGARRFRARVSKQNHERRIDALTRRERRHHGARFRKPLFSQLSQTAPTSRTPGCAFLKRFSVLLC